MITALLLSGGVDSVAVLIARRPEIDLCVFVDYGQPAVKRERLAAARVAASQMCRFVSARSALPCSQLSGGGPRVVPHRNAHLIVQASAAATIEFGVCDRVFVGATAGDQADYADCRAEFFERMGCALGCLVEAPALLWPRQRCIRMVTAVGLLSETWSCYESGPEPCGACASCLQ